MAHFLKLLMACLIASMLAACGGGGGSPGATTSGAPQTPVSNLPLLSLALQDAGASTTSVSASGSTRLVATLTDSSGLPIPNQLITVSGDPTKVLFPEGNTGLTNASGIATIKLARASLTATGADTLAATYAFKVGSFATFPNGTPAPTADTVVNSSLSYQLSAANVTLTNLDVGTGPLPAYGTRQVSVQANINGGAANTSVQVSFTASCGQVAPSSVTTNASGVAFTTFSATDPNGSTTSATQGCGGRTVEITASTPGASGVAKSLSITAAPATNMSFVAVTPSRIYLANSGGASQAIAEFKLVNAVGDPLQGQSVALTLKTVNGGIPKATLGTIGNTAAVTLITDVNGKVSLPVFSGTVPTNVVVNAALVSNPAVQTDSAVLTIASGRPAQARVSLAIEKWAIEGQDVDGATSNVTMSLADRQGNPVPDGTAVNFVTEGGVMIPPVCVTGTIAGNSQCTVQIRSQNPRATNGRISILAYAAGEEDFVDSNFNNVYDCGEAFSDLGTAFRDDNENGAFDTGEFSVPRDATASACGVGTVPSPQAGDGVWGAADVRRQSIIVFSTSKAVITGTFQSPLTTTVTNGTATSSFTSYVGLDLVIGDGNGNSMPTGSVITYTALDRTPGGATSCAIAGPTSATIPNSYIPIAASVGFTGCVTGDLINVKVTTPGGFTTLKDFAIP